MAYGEWSLRLGQYLSLCEQTLTHTHLGQDARRNTCTHATRGHVARADVHVFELCFVQLLEQ